MFNKQKKLSLFQQIAIPMFIASFLGILVLSYFTINLKQSIYAHKTFYKINSAHISIANNIEKRVAAIQILALKHLATESAADMSNYSTLLTVQKTSLNQMINTLKNLLPDNQQHSDSFLILTSLETLFNGYLKEISNAMLQSQDFEKEVALKILNMIENKYVDIIDDKIHQLINLEFNHLEKGQDVVFSKTTNNLQITTMVSIALGITLLSIAFYISRIFALRLKNLLVWSKTFSEDITAAPLPVQQNDEIGMLTQAMNTMSETVSQSYIQLGLAKQSAEEGNHAKTAFLANMSHELRTPMHGILSYANMGVKRIEHSTIEKNLKYFKNIKISADRLMILLNDLLDLAKLEAGKMQMVYNQGSLQEIAKSCLTEQHARLEELNINIIWHPDSIIGEGVFDAARIGQVITNFLSNAIKYTPEAQSIEFLIANDQIQSDDADNIPALLFSIIDHGQGVPDNELKLIFNKFEQSSDTVTGTTGGTGLGLAICKEIIMAHSGKIWAENHPSAGAVFSFIIPMTQN